MIYRIHNGEKRSDLQPRTFYTIKEISEITGVPAYTLRFWEKRLGDVIKPLRTAGGQRRYTDQHIEQIRVFKSLVSERGMTLTGARRVMLEGQLTGNKAGETEMKKIFEEIKEIVRDRLFYPQQEEIQ